MTFRIRPAIVVLIAVLAVLAVLGSTVAAYAKEEAQPTEARLSSCATQDGDPDANFWRLVEESRPERCPTKSVRRSSDSATTS